MNNKKTMTFAIVSIIAAVFILGYVTLNSRNKNSSNVNDSNTKDSFSLVFNEWGVVAELDEKLNASYELENIDYYQLANLSFPEFTDKFDESTKNCAIWSFARYKIGSTVDWDGEDGIKIENTYKAKNGMIKRLGDYYYERKYPQDGCLGSNEDQNDQLNKIDRISVKLFESLKISNQ